MPLDPISTFHPVTGAIRPVTPTLLAETYLCPLPASFEDVAAIREAKNMPWADSLSAAPEATVRAVARALRDLIHAAPALDPASIHAERLPESRARVHLTALRDLWRDIGGLPADLAPLTHARGCDAGDALAPLALMSSGDRTGATSADCQLAALLERHHGSREVHDAFPGLCPAGTNAALRAFQAGTPDAGSYTLRVTAFRDPLQELRFAAARAQRLLDTGAVASADEIGLLLPDDPAWRIDAEAVFAGIGLHLGGLPGAGARDRDAEAVHLLLTVLNKPAPGMAMVALDALGFGTGDEELRRLLGRAPLTRADLSRTLQAIAARIPSIAAPLRSLAVHSDEMPVDWDGLIAAARPGSKADAPTTASKESVSVFTEGATPWREVRQLLAIGFAGDRFPTVSGSSPLWLEHEIDLVGDRCGIALPGRQRALDLGLARLMRHLSAASEGIEITLPLRSRAGERLAPAAALDMLAHRVGRKTEDLIVLLPDDPARWPCDAQSVASVPDSDRPYAPVAPIIEFKRDLTGLRLEHGSPKPQSPSRLEMLLVSPLAWLLRELEIEDLSWSPDALDAMVRGSVMHASLEALFPPGPPPAPDDVRAAVPGVVDAIIARDRDLRFLGAPAWAIERNHLISDLKRAGARWAEILTETGTTIHKVEEWLNGAAFGMPLHGKADVVLKLANGGYLVVDYKSGSSRKRIKRMEEGWDMQAQLYGEMIAASDLVDGANAISVGYLNLADMIAVSGGTSAPDAFGPLDVDTSAEARARLTDTVAELKRGIVRLNGADDAGFFDARGVSAYALDNALVDAFLLESEE